MGLKVNSSFLKFLTMGAIGTRRVKELMEAAGLQPIELERYSCTNKIWSTKVKRMRQPDLLCVRTGLRVEVRAKSELVVKMSEAPGNADRRWNTGLRREDLIAFIQVQEADGRIEAADNAELFSVATLEDTVNQSVVGPPKGTSEGAERDRQWPVTVAKVGGVITGVGADHLSTRLDNGRNQSYRLRGKNAYLAVGEHFLAHSEFIAGIPAGKARFPALAADAWNPRNLLASENALDRHVAVKTLGFAGNVSDTDRLLQIAQGDEDTRVRLEAAAALVRLNDRRGLELLRNHIDEPEVDYFRMEATLALAEFHGTTLEEECADLLVQCANNPALAGNEVRQAAIWGLGKDGLQRYDQLSQFLDLEDEDERIHTVWAFGANCDAAVTRNLVETLVRPNTSERARASVSFVLSKIAAATVVPLLFAQRNHPLVPMRHWTIATLGQMNPDDVRPFITDPAFAAALEPFQIMSPTTNWIRSNTVADSLSFVGKQTLQ